MLEAFGRCHRHAFEYLNASMRALAYVQIYARLASQCSANQEYEVAEARDNETRRSLIQRGYEPILTDKHNVHYFRKPK